MDRPIPTFLIMTCLAASLVAGPSASAQTAEPPRTASQALEAMSLDDLFARLRVAPGERSADAIETEIVERFHESGSDTTDLLFSWALSSIQRDDAVLASDVLDQVVLIDPDFAEGWNKRATLAFMREDYGAAIADLRQVLRLEPRHFGALAGLGLILERLDRHDEALKAYRAALAIHPHLDSVRESAEKLEVRQNAREI